MTTEEAVALVKAKEGRLCGRFYQRPDGSVLTEDCPVGLARVHRQVRRTVMAAAALVAFLFTSVAMARQAQAKGGVIQKGRAAEAIDEALWEAKVKLGLAPKPVVLGKMCIPLPVPSTNSATTTPPKSSPPVTGN